MAGKKYPYYDVGKLETLRDLVWEHSTNDKKEQTAFTYRRKKEVVRKTYQQFASEVRILGEYFLCNYDKSHIGIYGENSYEWLLFYFAVVTVGKVAVPVDAGLSAEDSLDLIKRSDCDVVVYSDTYRDIAECWRKTGLDILLLNMNKAADYMEFAERNVTDSVSEFERTEQKTGKNSSETEQNAKTYKYDSISISEDHIAAIVYTSGTTGKSKGVVLTHKNICADIVNACQSFRVYGRVVAVLPFHHIFGLLASVMMIFHYAQPVHINHSLKYIMKDIQEFKPQTLLLVPLYVETFYKQIFDAVRKQGKEKKLKSGMKLSSLFLRFGMDFRKKWFREILDRFGGKLDYIICGGAALDPFYVKEFHKLGIEVYNGYGITECASVISVNRNRNNVVGSVGQVIPCCEARISEDGEILVKGDNVFREYYQDTENTEKSFTDGWYHTGDLGYLENASLYITGRKKNLIILSNGENVSPEGIEQELLQMDSICEVIVRGEGNHLLAEIFPAEEVMEKDYEAIIADEIENWNRRQPMYRRIGNIRCRMTEFEKTTSRKIKR